MLAEHFMVFYLLYFMRSSAVRLTFRQVLSIHAYNHQGASGIVVMSRPEFNFYTTSREDRLFWRCREVHGQGQ